MRFTSLLAWACAPTEMQAFEIWRRESGAEGVSWIVTNTYQAASTGLINAVKRNWLLSIPCRIARFNLSLQWQIEKAVKRLIIGLK